MKQRVLLMSTTNKRPGNAGSMHMSTHASSEMENYIEKLQCIV